MAFVQRSADQQQRHLSFNIDRLNVLQNLDSIRDEPLDILKTFKEQHGTVQDVLIGTLRYTTAGCYYGYFGREGLG